MDVREKSSNGKRLIDAEGLRRRIIAFATGLHSEVLPVDTALMLLTQMQTIDAVPVVRCWECKQGEVDDPDFPDQYYCHAGCGWNKGDFYCAYGDRKEGAD